MDESDCLEKLFMSNTFHAADMVGERERRRWDLWLKKHFREWHDAHGTWIITQERKIRRVSVA